MAIFNSYASLPEGTPQKKNCNFPRRFLGEPRCFRAKPRTQSASPALDPIAPASPSESVRLRISTHLAVLAS